MLHCNKTRAGSPEGSAGVFLSKQQDATEKRHAPGAGVETGRFQCCLGAEGVVKELLPVL
jgi:hypothetical protein